MNIIEIDREPVELFKVLKFEGIASSGGEAKQWIGDGLVQVNDAVETRKRRKLLNGDRIEFDGRQYLLQRI